MTKEQIRIIINSMDIKTKYLIINKDNKEYVGTFQIGHFNNTIDNKKLEDKNRWLFDFKPGFGKGYQLMIEGDEVEVLRETF